MLIVELLYPRMSVSYVMKLDISVTKKLSVYCRVVDPDTLEPSIHFVCNVAVDSGTGKAIHRELKTVMAEKNLPTEKVMGLGTDGARAMTGMGEGLTGYMTRHNPMLVNYHCVAHWLALVTAQAAGDVPYLVDYQNVLTGIFYYFKASAVRCHKLIEIQDLLDEPTLKVKEVHQKADIAVSLIKVHVENCKRELNDIKSGKTRYHLNKFQSDYLTMERGKLVFKSNHIVQGKQNIDSIKQKLFDGILKRLEDRFPDDESNLVYAFGVLSMLIL